MLLCLLEDLKLTFIKKDNITSIQPVLSWLSHINTLMQCKKKKQGSATKSSTGNT